MKKLLTALAFTGVLIFSAVPAFATQPGAIFSAQQATPHCANADKSANVDPIVAPGPSCTPSEHPHVFAGSIGVDSNSTADTMLASPTAFVEQGIHSGAWWPEVRYNGTLLCFGTSSSCGGKDALLYYRENTSTPNAVAPPLGLKMVLGPKTLANGQVVNLGDEIIFKCGPGSSVDMAQPPAQCDSGVLVDSYRFPNCWDGQNLDTVNPDGTPAVNPQTGVVYPNDHLSHMAYPVGNACPASHPVNVWRIEQFRRSWYGTGTHDINLLTFGGHSWSTAHADYMFAWEPDTIADFEARCITPNVACATNINLAN